MLYKNFIVCIMTCALLAMINMIYDHLWEYLILPIGILIWGSYFFFNENDRNFLKSKGINPDDYNSSFFDFLDGDYGYNYNNHPIRSGNTITWNEGNISRVEDTFDSDLFRGGATDHTRYQPTARGWEDPRYKGMVKKCKRNFKITVENKKEHEEKPRRTVFFSAHSSRA